MDYTYGEFNVLPPLVCSNWDALPLLLALDFERNGVLG